MSRFAEGVARISSTARHGWFNFVRNLTPSSLLITLVIALDLALVATAFVATQYFSFDALTSLTFFPRDGNWSSAAGGTCVPEVQGIGIHCFGDYTLTSIFSGRANPWDLFLGYHFNYTAAGMLPQRLFSSIGILLSAPRVGLYLYLLALIACLCAPAVWATKGKSIAVKLIAIGAFGVLSVPGLMALDRGNSVALAVPILLIFLIGLRREQYWLVALTVVLAGLVKPQFAAIALILLAGRKWRQFFATIGSVAITNLLAYLAWPTAFPNSILQSIANTLNYGGTTSLGSSFPTNVSFARGAYVVERLFQGLVGSGASRSWIDGHQAIVGAAILFGVAITLFLLGSRVPLHIGGLLLMASSALAPGVAYSYYLVFALPIAAIIFRDPGGPVPVRDFRGGMLDTARDRSLLTLASAFALVLATAMSVSRVLLPMGIEVVGYGGPPLLRTTGELVPLLWIIAIALSLVAWGTKPRSVIVGATDTTTS